MIEEFVRALTRIRELKQKGSWGQASDAVNNEFNRLVGAGAQAIAAMSDTDLLARLVEGEPTQAVAEKAMILASLLKEAGDLSGAQGRERESRECFLKALHLLLDTLERREVFEVPEFVPAVEVLVASLSDSPLPVETNARLMQHYERTGEFAKAEDALFAMHAADPASAGIIEFGLTFYDRLRRLSDSSLLAGNLPRHELETGMAELDKLRSRLS